MNIPNDGREHQIRTAWLSIGLGLGVLSLIPLDVLLIIVFRLDQSREAIQAHILIWLSIGSPAAIVIGKGCRAIYQHKQASKHAGSSEGVAWGRLIEAERSATSRTNVQLLDCYKAIAASSPPGGKAAKAASIRAAKLAKIVEDAAWELYSQGTLLEMKGDSSAALEKFRQVVNMYGSTAAAKDAQISLDLIVKRT